MRNRRESSARIVAAVLVSLLLSVAERGPVEAAVPYVQQAIVTASDAAAHDEFGNAMALSRDGTTLVVGANTKNTGTGAAYVFVRNGVTWDQQAKLTASGGATHDNFGTAVAISADGNTAVIGAQGNQGAAYIFTRSGTTWAQLQKLTFGGGYADFGCSVAISADAATILIGAFYDTSHGSAYVYSFSGVTWGLQATLDSNDALSNDEFGDSVALSGDGNAALIGAPTRINQVGAAYLFARSGASWGQQSDCSRAMARPSRSSGTPLPSVGTARRFSSRRSSTSLGRSMSTRCPAADGINKRN
ncbi:MAG: FG-GAP repeat protein [Thermomicrobiales bacterium]